jgi:hypothetical protein
MTDAAWDRWLGARCPICFRDPTTSDHPCHCEVTGAERCIDGSVYGPCDDPHCHDACERRGRCECECHAPAGIVSIATTTAGAR